MSNGRTAKLWVGLMLGAVLMATTPQSAEAAGAKPATPVGSPGDWITSGDYPSPALRYELEGVAEFRLTIAPTGSPTDCTITGSSGSDVLDDATCAKVMARARFRPALDSRGQPVSGSYSNKVRWVLPRGAFLPMNIKTLLRVDRAGEVIGCEVDPAVVQIKEVMCGPMLALSRQGGLQIRGGDNAEVSEVTMELATGYGEGPPASMLTLPAGVRQISMGVAKASVSDGRMIECRFTEQRGDIHLMPNPCRDGRQQYDPPFSAVRPDGTIAIWQFFRATRVQP